MKDTFINCARGLKVAVIGDIMLDVYVDGTVERLSPEAPNCIVLDETKKSYALGGAANVARNLSAFGAEVSLMGSLGTYENSIDYKRLSNLLAQESDNSGGRFHVIEIHEETNEVRPTTTKTRYRSAGQQLLRVDREARFPVKMDDQIRDSVLELIDGAHVLVLSDYGKGVLSDGMIDCVMSTWNDVIHSEHPEGPRPIFVDPKRKRLLDYSVPSMFLYPQVICPNAKEWQESEEFKDNNATLLGSIPHVIVTDGAKGCFEVDWHDELDSWTKKYHTPNTAVDVCDPAGAGDTFLAALVVALMNTEEDKLIAKEIGEACDVANTVASLVVAEHGVVAPEASYVAAMLKEAVPA